MGYRCHKTEKYSEILRKFAITLRYYSPRAYNYVRNKFGDSLPHPNTIKKWYKWIHDKTESGICKGSLEILKKKVEELQQHGKELICGIVHDEMYIKQHVEYLHATKEFSGFINYGKVPDDCENLPIAKEVLVFLINGITIPFNIPIAYYFISSLEGIDKVFLLRTITNMLTNIGVKVASSTFDGAPNNISAGEILGCSYDLEDFRPYFTNPNDGSKIYTFLDPAHMLKLIRNYIGSGNIFYDRLARAISWEYFHKLVAITETTYSFTHKMTKAHLNYAKGDAMKVSLAVQTLSSSVASSMKSLLVRKFPGFENAGGTIEFTQRMDILFDTLNSDGERPDNRYKSAINSESKSEIFAILDDTFDYIKKLTVGPSRLPVLKSSSNVGFKGMLIGIENVKSIYTDFVETKRLDLFHARRVGQCPLESLFSRCRSSSMLGFNTNPTVSQFRSIMRKITTQNEITSPADANCMDHLKILFVSSTPKNTTANSPENGSSNSTIINELDVFVNCENENPDCDEEIFICLRQMKRLV